MILKDIIGLLNNPMKILIVSTEGTEFYRGYRGNFKTTVHDDAPVKAVELFTEIERKPQRLHVLPSLEKREVIGSTENGEPIPDFVTGFEFKDLKMDFYQKITIKK